MVGIVRRLRVGARLAVGFAAVVVLTSVAAVVGLVATGSQREAATRVDRFNNLARQIHTLEKHNAALSGMQTYYIWEVAVYGPAKAFAPDAVARNMYLVEKETTETDLRQVDTAAMTAEQRAMFDEVRKGLADFFAYDDKLVAGYQAGRIAETDQFYGTSDYYTPVVEQTAKLLASATQLADAATRAANDDAGTARRLMIGALLASVLAAALIAWVVTGSITAPVRGVVDSMRRLAARDLTGAAGGNAEGRDELAQMQRAVGAAVEDIRQIVTAMTGIATDVQTTSERVRDVSGEAVRGTRDTAAQAGTVAGIAQEISRSTQTVAAGAEEMGASIREIAHSANEAARVAAEAVSGAAAANETVNKLGDSSNEISNVVKLITTIAEQTNLLALNATIEAARAGDAGKGFAVVASEVKDLAQATAQATENISRRIEAIQTDAAGAIDAITSISQVIENINHYQATIASAVDEQTATTAEMSRSVGQIAAGSERMAANIGTVAGTSADTLRALDPTEQAVDHLVTASHRLNEIVGTFRVDR